MNTQTRVHRIETGQALPLEGEVAVLTEGEVLVQAPPRWLAGQVFVPAAVRLVAPAVLPREPSTTVVAVRASSVSVRVAAPLFSRATLAAAWAWTRALPRQGKSRAQGAGAGIAA